MTSVSMTFADLYEGLKHKAIDCVYTTAGNTTFKPYGLTEVAKYYAPMNGWTPLTAAGFIINLDVWNSFPVELQQVVEEASIEALATHSSGAFEVIAEFGARAEADGVEFLETDELRKILARWAGLLENVVTQGDEALDGKALRDAFADWSGSIDWDAFAAALHEQAESKGRHST